MSIPRVFSQGRAILSRGFNTSLATSSVSRTAFLQRQFSSGVRFNQEVIETPAKGPEVPLAASQNGSSGNNASRSIAIMKVPKRAVKADIEELLQNAGFDM
jgi:hypothetical protein